MAGARTQSTRSGMAEGNARGCTTAIASATTHAMSGLTCISPTKCRTPLPASPVARAAVAAAVSHSSMRRVERMESQKGQAERNLRQRRRDVMAQVGEEYRHRLQTARAD